MKIYANDNNTITPFDEYVGKDVWVACYNDPSQQYLDYVRFLNKFVKANGAVIFEVDRIGEVYLKYYRSHPHHYNPDSSPEYDPHYALQLATHKKVYSDSLLMAKPVIVQTTADLFGFDDNSFDNPLIDKLIGKPYWVLAKIGRTSSYITFYHRFGDIVNCAYIYDFNIDSTHFDEDENPDYWIHKETLHLDSIDIKEPLELLTDDEVHEAYDAARANYEELHGDDDEDY